MAWQKSTAVQQVWRSVVALLAYPHVWVRKAAGRLVGLLLSSPKLGTPQYTPYLLFLLQQVQLCEMIESKVKGVQTTLRYIDCVWRHLACCHVECIRQAGSHPRLVLLQELGCCLMKAHSLASWRCPCTVS